jgi:diaminohydroxyphosphoribosylaminopyrimidine deaminase/5-amino-6-(5-phosphoribosylamino)uracil reductase
MARAIQLAKNGSGSTAPNPMVGAVIVHENKIIGEGFTSPYGGSHAEVNAIQSVTDTALLKSATLYVTLEPCSHFGKTPPCADLIVKHKIPKVVIGVLDPHEKVAGKGVQKLKDSGCEVIIGVLEKECSIHHKRFLNLHQKKRPYIILKWAETIDGFIAPGKEKRKDNPEPFWITNTYSRQIVHQWRAEEQAVLVGTNTVLEDNPKLDVRKWIGNHPLRVILDRELKIPNDYHVLDGSIPTIIFTSIIETSKHIKGNDYIIIDFSKNVAVQIAHELYKKNINSIIIEGGSQTLQTFIDVNLWDEARVFTGPITFDTGIRAPKLPATTVFTKKIKQDTINIYRND